MHLAFQKIIQLAIYAMASLLLFNLSFEQSVNAVSIGGRSLRSLARSAANPSNTRSWPNLRFMRTFFRPQELDKTNIKSPTDPNLQPIQQQQQQQQQQLSATQFASQSTSPAAFIATTTTTTAFFVQSVTNAERSIANFANQFRWRTIVQCWWSIKHIG